MERFEFQNKDMPMLKKDIFFRLIFMLLFAGIFGWQLVLLIMSYIRDDLTAVKTIVAVAVLMFALMFAVISFIYAFRSLGIVQKIALHGSAVKSMSIISNAKKNSFLRIYLFATQLISLVLLVVLCCTLTYTILDYVYHSNISFYLPVLLFISMAGFNSVYHIKAEIKTIQNVREFNNIF